MNNDINHILTERAMPTHIEAERFILGAIILTNDLIERCIEQRLRGDDFFLVSHRRIFAAMCNLFEDRRAIDPLTLGEQLRVSGEIDLVGGGAYLASLFDGVPRFSNIDEYTEIVINRSKLRQLIWLGDRIAGRAFSEDTSLDEQLRQAERELLGVGGSRGDSTWTNLADAGYETMLEAERRAASQRTVLDFSTGLSDLDYATLGFERGTIVVIGAAPGMGKTALALSLSRSMSRAPENVQPDGRPAVIGWFSMEMPVKQQAQRMIASLAGVNLREYRLGRLSKDQWRRVAGAIDEMHKWRLFFDDRGGLSTSQMREAGRRLKREQGSIDILMVDYVQLANGEQGKNETEATAIGKVMKGLVDFAKDFNCCVIALSQLNREHDARADHKPNLRSFKGSSWIEQAGYTIIGLHREDVYKPDSLKQNIAELILLKNRNGPLGTIETVFLPQLMRFEDKFKGDSYAADPPDRMIYPEHDSPTNTTDYNPDKWIEREPVEEEVGQQ